MQLDQGSNFTSKISTQVVCELGVRHSISSAYYLECQGALERFHQTFKNMLRTFCLDAEKEWNDGVPLLLAIRHTVQESTGFSSAELVFGPLMVLQEK